MINVSIWDTPTKFGVLSAPTVVEFVFSENDAIGYITFKDTTFFGIIHEGNFYYNREITRDIIGMIRKGLNHDAIKAKMIGATIIAKMID